MARLPEAMREHRIRWPLCSAADADVHAEALFARAFGFESRDLSVDFALARPFIVTALLAACLKNGDGSALDEDVLWKWTLPKRTQGLLAIAAATGGMERRYIARCPSDKCSEIMDVELRLEIFRQPCAEASFVFSSGNGPSVEVNLPTGANQLRYLEDSAANPRALVADLLAAGAEPPVDEHWFEQLETALERHDPLTATHLSMHCPYCGADNSVEFDLEEYLLREFDRAQQRLLYQIHILASGYHWTESDILSLPAGRRDYYIDCIREEPVS